MLQEVAVFTHSSLVEQSTAVALPIVDAWHRAGCQFLMGLVEDEATQTWYRMYRIGRNAMIWVS